MASLRLVVRTVVCGLAVLAVCAPAAHAGLLSGTLPGVVSPSDTPATCDTATSQPFTRWNDYANYVLVPGGSFESGTTGWTLSRGTSVVSGNEPYYVRSRSDKRSLYIPAGGYATTPPMCFGLGDWHLRLFAASSKPSTLRVQVVVKSLCGVISTLDGGTVQGDSTWEPSPRLSLLLTNVTGLVATDAVSFRFVPSDNASWRIDDVYLDPWKDL